MARGGPAVKTTNRWSSPLGFLLYAHQPPILDTTLGVIIPTFLLCYANIQPCTPCLHHVWQKMSTNGFLTDHTNIVAVFSSSLDG